MGSAAFLAQRGVAHMLAEPWPLAAAKYGDVMNGSPKDVLEFGRCRSRLRGAVGYDDAGCDEEVSRQRRKPMATAPGVTSMQSRADVYRRVPASWSPLGHLRRSRKCLKR